MFSGWKTFVENAAASAVEVAEAAAEAVHSSSTSSNNNMSRRASLTSSSSIPLIPNRGGRTTRFSSGPSSLSSLVSSGDILHLSSSQYEQRKNHLLQIQRLHMEILDNPDQWYEFQNTLRSKMCITTNGAIRTNLLEALETTSLSTSTQSSSSSSFLICKDIPSTSTEKTATTTTSTLSSSTSSASSSDSLSLCSQDSSNNGESQKDQENRDDKNNEEMDEDIENTNSKKSDNRCRTLSTSSTDSSSVCIQDYQQEQQYYYEASPKITRRLSITGSLQQIGNGCNSNTLISNLTTNDIQRYEQNELKRRSKNGNISPFDSSNYNTDRSKLITALNGTTAITRKFYSSNSNTNNSNNNNYKKTHQEGVVIVDSSTGSLQLNQNQQQKQRRRMSLQYSTNKTSEIPNTINNLLASTIKLTSNLSNDVMNAPKQQQQQQQQRRRNSIFTSYSPNPAIDNVQVTDDNDNLPTLIDVNISTVQSSTTTSLPTISTAKKGVAPTEKSSNTQSRRHSLSFFNPN